MYVCVCACNAVVVVDSSSLGERHSAATTQWSQKREFEENQEGSVSRGDYSLDCCGKHTMKRDANNNKQGCNTNNNNNRKTAETRKVPCFVLGGVVLVPPKNHIGQWWGWFGVCQAKRYFFCEPARRIGES